MQPAPIKSQTLTLSRRLVVTPTYALLTCPSSHASLQVLYDSLDSVVVNTQSVPKDKYIPIQAVYGIVGLPVNKYLIVVIQAQIVGQVFKCRIYRVTRVMMVVLSGNENPMDLPLKNQIKKYLEDGSFYYSDEYDLTNKLSVFVQNGMAFSPDKRNNRYFYNFALLDQFIKVKASEWITAFVHGSVVCNYLTLYSEQFNCSLMLVSRMDRERQGARWFCRGCDSNGHAAFKVETEIIFSATGAAKNTTNVFSYVQVRGQMPLIWSQRPDLLLVPQINLLRNEKVHLQILKNYLRNLKERHGSVCLVNLMDKSDQSEKRLAEYYEMMLKSFPLQSIRHTWLEFKTASVGDDPHKVESMLVEKLEEFIHVYGYYHIELQPDECSTIVSRNDQIGLFRMTSMDCLLRTDIAQRIISKSLLQGWIYKIKAVKDRLHTHHQKFPPPLEEIFNDTWQLNSSRLSVIYSGTTNIKQDLLVYGRRRKSAVLVDYCNVFKRYILGTFYDWNKQNISDILTGKLSCKGKSIATTSHKYLIGASLLVLMVVWGMFQLVEEALEDSEINNLLPIQVFWSFLSVMAVVLVVKNNRFLPRPHISY